MGHPAVDPRKHMYQYTGQPDPNAQQKAGGVPTQGSGSNNFYTHGAGAPAPTANTYAPSSAGSMMGKPPTPTTQPVGSPTMATAQTPGVTDPAAAAPPLAQQSAPTPPPSYGSYTGQGSVQGGGGSGGYNGQSGIGGISAVNPQANQVDYNTLNQNFIDPAYEQAMSRLNPQLEQQSDTFDQQMINRGIGVGSEAYSKAKQQMDFGQNDARNAASFGAMQFGLGAQNQMFGQDAQRSGLANALLRSRWGLDEQSRQFDQGLGFQQGRAEMDDLRWLDGTNYRDRSYNDQQDWNHFNARQGMLGAIPGWNPAQIDVNGAAGAATNSQNSAFNAQNTMNQNAWGQITDVLGMGAMAFSDIRLKDNIKRVGKIAGHNIYTWTWNKAAKALGINDATIGVIAQEMPPEFVGQRNGYLAVNYEGLFNAAT